ncbi:protein with DOMON-like ligand-binding domain protein [Psychroserpens sp. NJDZ02]|nr:protein with DOMON-like ligand-binding domain protein [Psychroserpens sp. NJDZ02]
MKPYLLFLFAIIMSYQSIAQDKKSYQIKRTDYPPKIDGILDDKAWTDAQIATDFTEFKPDVGDTATADKKTKVRMTYDDSGIYVAAYCYDKPEDIMRQFTQRDNFGQSDFFGLIFNPNNDAQNNTEFFVFSSGTQADAVESPNYGEDFGWNAVWESSTKIVEDGWIVEIKIPYRALRFTQQEDPTWGIQFHRHYRKTREQTTWNAIDVTKGNVGLYNAELKGITNITPPTRLSFFPYASGLVSTYDGETDSDFAAGLDIKYGITENLTLDATLIPDFSQAGFDDVQLNLGPFEQQFSEQRQFFTEGVDLFSKGNLFYSRRVGNSPSGRLNLNDNETIQEYPEKVQLLNAVKVSGRTKNGLGIGFFNAITEKTEVSITDAETGGKRSQVVEPLANYNIMVLDQQFNKNSSVTLINTNVTRDGDFRDANVTGLLLDLVNKNNTYGAVAEVKMSTFNDVPDKDNGYNAQFAMGKNSGKLRYSIDYSYADENYDINDLGILFRNNYSNYGADISYRTFEPSKNFNNTYLGAWLNYEQLANPNTFTGANTGIEFNGQTKTLHNLGINSNWNIGKQYDYFEPRNGFDSYFLTENYAQTNMWISSNYNLFFAIDANLGYGRLFNETRKNFNNVWFGLNPRFKFNDKFLMVLGYDYDNYTADRGYVNGQEIDDRILFGQRDRIDMTASISGSYNFNSFNALTLSFRNYLSTVTYDNNLYVLQNNGTLIESDIYTKNTISSDPDFDPDINFNTWNLDLSYTWQFAPGSQLTALYRNQIFNLSNNSEASFFDSTDDLFKQKQRNTFSLKLVYFIDYSDLKNVLKKKSKTS